MSLVMAAFDGTGSFWSTVGSIALGASVFALVLLLIAPRRNARAARDLSVRVWRGVRAGRRS
jgi:hypothetical protein